ncbi:hypothetical protein J2Q11_11485 [Tenacibaculum finnmarkense genomovar finnmarkense]|uniref:hypothetical protein n=1 Tax=Tenacibaculum finnmarkense TaxID=2781243 RepID=UPI001E2CCD06|nr:hypothetical protein [Tenacibaculum finnmarkense]MCD8418317.1 hypothetical protein [Tenacibaculum finnmarkense genomovar finnmarkense]MCG8186650.1 hypothetical protein [Tenacibaculum finnmarkense genomovar finnmarkense]MCG8203184.1 hypothetical protein [Tenacibaculum finnmarkense genomovar finnmarkense]MCG8210557.1 hypothetical protein [Tenacibaculum finnmarkense genomovar finnmarkense]MCG8213418.1 hypothetical protein [Tenacibaculum finnmarkense genomovar finnmarkense]
MKEIEIYLICFLSSLIGSGLGIFISAFLKKKGENLATKQDIESITKKIENVKFNLSKKLEILKINQAEIQLKKQRFL